MDIGKQFDFHVQGGNDCNDDTIRELLTSHGMMAVDLINLLALPLADATQILSQRIGSSRETSHRYLQSLSKKIGIELEPSHQIKRKYISTGLNSLDFQMMGGIPIGEITELYGSSATGKSQFLLNLALKCQEYKSENEVSACIYISTESPIETTRLTAFADGNDPPENSKLKNISCIYCHDFESQDHIIFTQLSAKLEKCRENNERIRAVIIDSIAHHLRTDDAFINNLIYLTSFLANQNDEIADLVNLENLNQRDSVASALRLQYFKGDQRFKLRMAKKYYLLSIYHHLAKLARTYDVAVIVANQVSDAISDSLSENPFDEEDPLDLAAQIGTFSGWDMMSKTHHDNSKDKVLSSSISRESRREANSLIIGKRMTETGSEEPILNKKQRLPNTPKMWPVTMPATIMDKQCEFPPIPSSYTEYKLPALGHTWSKLVSYRILLWRLYLPTSVLRVGSQTQMRENQVTEDLFEKPPYSIRRFAKIISSKTCTKFSDSTEFVISDSIIHERTT